jgi:pyroglutamyl-peptidase
MLALITGFGPFPGAPVNPSAMLAKALARRRRPAFATLDRSLHVFATRYSSVDRELPKLMAQKPDIVLLFGVAGRRHDLCVETQARNAISLLFPDASRHRPQQGVIEKGAPAVLKGNAPFPKLVGAAKTRFAASRLSRDAGRYMCNYVFWRALEHARDGGPLIQFVHIPMFSGKRRPKKPGRRRPSSLAELLNGAEALLIALMAASRHQR